MFILTQTKIILFLKAPKKGKLLGGSFFPQRRNFSAVLAGKVCHELANSVRIYDAASHQINKAESPVVCQGRAECVRLVFSNSASNQWFTDTESDANKDNCMIC
jgi:hypothetical protein